MDASRQQASDFESRYKGTIACDELTAARLVFFDLEIGQISPAVYDGVMADQCLAPYRHYLDHEREHCLPDQIIFQHHIRTRGVNSGIVYTHNYTPYIHSSRATTFYRLGSSGFAHCLRHDNTRAHQGHAAHKTHGDVVPRDPHAQYDTDDGGDKTEYAEFAGTVFR